MFEINLSLGLCLIAEILLLIAGFFVFRRICVRRRERPCTFEGLFSQSRIAMATEKRLRDDFEWFDAHRSREICAISHDGLRLFATVVKAPEGITPKGVVMLFHGFRSNARRDFCMQMKILHEAGYHLLVADQRSHSRSAGRYICYGVKERYDVITWREKAAELFGEDMPIAIMGLSMGGATVLMASELIDDADTAVKCIVADCPFSSLKGIITHVMKSRNKLPFAKLLLTFAGFWARMLAGFTLSAPSSAEIYSNSSLPALIIHGGDDDYVPIDHSVDIKNHAKERVKLVEIDGARHAEAIYCDEEKYTCELIDFLDEYMS